MKKYSILVVALIIFMGVSSCTTMASSSPVEGLTLKSVAVSKNVEMPEKIVVGDDSLKYFSILGGVIGGGYYRHAQGKAFRLMKNLKSKNKGSVRSMIVKETEEQMRKNGVHINDDSPNRLYITVTQYGFNGVETFSPFIHMHGTIRNHGQVIWRGQVTVDKVANFPDYRFEDYKKQPELMETVWQVYTTQAITALLENIRP